MRVFKIFGPSGTGKTFLIEKLIKTLELKVAYVKLTRHKGPFDKEGKDTYRVYKAGVKRIGLVPEKGFILFDYEKQVELVDFLKRFFIGYELVLIEGDAPIVSPAIQCITNEKDEIEDELILGYCSLKEGLMGVWHIEKDFEKIKETVIRKALPLLPHLDCGECGVQTCREFGKLYLEGKKKLKDCRVIFRNLVSVSIDGKRIEIKEFVQEFIAGMIIGAMETLRGFEKGKKLVIHIDLDKFYEKKQGFV